MRPTEPVSRPAPSAAPPRWNEVLRALREARGITQDGWAAHIGVSHKTVQRWEAGERAPDAGAEAAIMTYCRERGLFRTFARGPLAGLELTPELLHDLLAEVRWRKAGSRQLTAGSQATEVATTQDSALSNQDLPANIGPSASPTLRPTDGGASGAVVQPPPANLPAALTSFVGRERELADVRCTLAGTRLLTLTGAGGCGKTRLALALAAEVLWAYQHGVCFVELAPLADPTLVPATVAASLGLQTVAQRPPHDVLVEHLASRHLLLLLDNCEHLVPACAVLVETLLRACPHLEVLTTSREPLGLGGETIWRVPPLSLPGPRSAGRSPETVEMRSSSDDGPPNADSDAVRLFVERARLYQPDFALTAANEAAVVQICARLDGIPLAIELAAACVKVLAVEQIGERLADRFRLLTGGSRTALPRHQTLRATLDWSYDRLSPAEQRLLRALSVFAGGFTLEAAEAITNAECGMRNAECGELAHPNPQSAIGNPQLDVLELLTRLVDTSLVIAEEWDGAVRYRLLETVRQYAEDKLAGAGEDGAVRERHLVWCLALAETAATAARGPEEADWLARLEQEHDNLRAALRWALAHSDDQGAAALRLAGALARFWKLRDHLSEGRRWLEQALSAGGNATAGLRAPVLLGAGQLAYAQGDYVAARALCTGCLHLSQEVGDRVRMADAQVELGMVALRCGEYAAARAFLQAGLALHTEQGNKAGIAGAQTALGFVAQRQGDHAAARTHLEASIVLHRDLGDKHGLADALDDLATLDGEQGRIERHAALLEESLTLFRELGATSGVARVLDDMGISAWMQGDYDRARALIEESVVLYRNRGETRGIARALGNLAVVALSQRDYPRAATLCRESLVLFRDIGDGWGIGRYLPALAGAVSRQGRSERAACLCGAAAVLRERLGTPLPPVVQPNHDRMVAGLRRALGEEAFAAAWEAGAAMSLEEAVDHALADAPPAATQGAPRTIGGADG